MDIYCGHCNEPWDRGELRKETRECDLEGWITHEGRHQRVGPCDGGTIYVEPYLPETSPAHDFLTGGNEPQSCSECKGEGKHECEDCNGEGYLPGEEESVTEENECVPCRGTGKIECEECSGRGYFPDTCDTCHEELDGGYFETIGVIGDGYLQCLSCAKEAGAVSEEAVCPECKGTGKLESETAIGTHADIDRFRKGEGCPCCDWGNKVLTHCPECLSNAYGYVGERCRNYVYLDKCKGTLAETPADVTAQETEARERKTVLRALLGDDLDGLACAHEDHIKP